MKYIFHYNNLINYQELRLDLMVSIRCSMLRWFYFYSVFQTVCKLGWNWEDSFFLFLPTLPLLFNFYPLSTPSPSNSLSLSFSLYIYLYISPISLLHTSLTPSGASLMLPKIKRVTCGVKRYCRIKQSMIV